MTDEKALQLAQRYAQKWHISSFTQGGYPHVDLGDFRNMLVAASHCQLITGSTYYRGTAWRFTGTLPSGVQDELVFSLNESNQAVHVTVYTNR